MNIQYIIKREDGKHLIPQGAKMFFADSYEMAARFEEYTAAERHQKQYGGEIVPDQYQPQR